METKPTSAATYERARRIANQAIWSVSLQCRRLGTREPEDGTFLFRRWADFDFLIVSLTRFRRAAMIAARIQKIKPVMTVAIAEFDAALPSLKRMRDIAEHVDEYAVDSGRDCSVNRRALEVSYISRDGSTLEWLGGRLNTREALAASKKLFKTLKGASSSFVQGA